MNKTMRKIKFGIATILILFALCFTGELSILYLDTFMYQYYNADFYIETAGSKASSDEMKDDFVKASEKYGVDFYTVETRLRNSYLYETDIIGTNGAIEHLKRKGIREGLNKSVFFEAQQVNYIPYETAEDVSSFRTFFFIGGKEDYHKICEFKSALVDKYSGGFPHDVGSEKEVLLDFIAIWAPMVFILLMLTAYEVKCDKKECVIRVLTGQSINKICLNNIMKDILGYIIIFSVLSFILKSFSNVTFKLEWQAVIMILLIIINSLLNMGIVHLEYKVALLDGNDSSRMLSTNYTIKMILSVVVMLVIAINFVTISNAIELCKQKGFFYMHDNCSYYNMVFNNDLELNEGVDEEMPRDEYLYYRMYEKFQDRSYQYADMSDYYSMRYPFVMVNRNAFDEICRKNPQIDAIKNKVLQRNVSLLYPQKIKKGSVDYNNALDIRDYGFLNKREYGEWNILFYQNDVRVEGIHFDGSSPYYNKKIYKDPIILVNNSVYKSDSETGYDVFYNYDIMYDITNKQWNQFLQEENTDGLEVRLTNVKDEYEYTWQQRRRQMELTIVLIILIMILNVTMLSIVIRMEYRSNAVELALKKVYGYSLYNRNERIIKKSIISGVIGLFFALICNTFLKFEISILTLICTCTITICVEIVLILLIALSFEKRNIVMVLKGERI